MAWAWQFVGMLSCWCNGHLGIYGGSVANSLHALADAVAGLHLRNGSVSIPGFYECAPCLAPCNLVINGALHVRLCLTRLKTRLLPLMQQASCRSHTSIDGLRVCLYLQHL